MLLFYTENGFLSSWSVQNYKQSIAQWVFDCCLGKTFQTFLFERIFKKYLFFYSTRKKTQSEFSNFPIFLFLMKTIQRKDTICFRDAFKQIKILEKHFYVTYTEASVLKIN